MTSSQRSRKSCEAAEFARALKQRFLPRLAASIDHLADRTTCTTNHKRAVPVTFEIAPTDLFESEGNTQLLRFSPSA